MYAEGLISSADIHADLHELVSGHKPGRESDDERIYFNAVGLAYIDVAIGVSMYQRAITAGNGQNLDLQQCMIFEHENIMKYMKS
jgi:ornithine cyclodeaminase/alanine dehydrogenase-like protein (mu-crystallin family)